MSLGSRIAMLVGVSVLLATLIAGASLAFSSRSVGRSVIDRDLSEAAASFKDPDGRPDAPLLRAAFQLQVARCERTLDEPIESVPTSDQSGDATDIDVALDETGRENERGGRREPGRGPAANRGRFFQPQLRSGLQLIQPDGATAASCLSPFPPNADELAIAVKGTGQFIRSVTIEDEPYRVLTVGQGDLGAVQFAEELTVVESAVDGLLTRIIASGLIGALLAGALGWFWARRATKPVRELSDAAERVALTQDLGERIDVSGTDEIGTLAASFNQMLVSLDTSRAQQRRLVQDASHELRTPLTSLRTNVELLQRHSTISDDDRSAILADIQAELTELSDLTTELVESATELDQSPSARIETELQALAQACLDRADRRHAIDFSFTANSPGLVHVDPAAISRAIDNLIENAVKFTPADGQVTVSVTEGTVSVADTGPGIPQADLPNIFDRFYRATTARSAPGSGLGLSIVNQIAESHGGEVFASNGAEGGAVVGFTLPVVG